MELISQVFDLFHCLPPCCTGPSATTLGAVMAGITIWRFLQGKDNKKAEADNLKSRYAFANNRSRSTGYVPTMCKELGQMLSEI